MGFFAGELESVLEIHASTGSPWSILTRLGVHPQQIDRLKKAHDDISQVATLQATYLQQMRHELELTPVEWSRLQAGIQADIFLRLLLYHNYPLDEAADIANSVFALKLRNSLAVGGKTELQFAPFSQADYEQLKSAESVKPRTVRVRKAAQG